jgi:hypothetical protein
MPVTLTEVSEFTTNVVVPADGDNRNAASVVQGFQPLANRTKYLKTFDVSGELLGASYIYYSAGVGIIVGRIRKLVIDGVLLSTSGEEVVSTGSLTADSWNYLYARNNSGNLAFEWSTTGPENSRVFKSGDATRRFLCSVRTVISDVIPFRKENGRVIYKASDYVGGALIPATNGTTSSSTYVDVSFAIYIPPHSRILLMRMSAGGVDAASQVTHSVRTKGSTVGSYTIVATVGTAGDKSQRDIEIETDSDGVIEQKIVRETGTGTAAGVVEASGFLE